MSPPAASDPGEPGARRTQTELGRIAYVSAHDFQDPLRMVTSYVQLLDREYGDQLDDRARQYIAYAVEGSRRINELIRDLMAYAQLSAEEGTPGRIDSGVVLDRVLGDLRGQIREAEAVVTNGQLPVVHADPTRLAQVFQDLLTNALKFHEPGQPPEVHIDAEEHGDGMWRFSVTDQGIGMDPKYADQVFEIFTRLHSPDDYEGTGIGLAIVKRIVEEHGGEVWVETGQGTTVHFTLPSQGHTVL